MKEVQQKPFIFFHLSEISLHFSDPNLVFISIIVHIILVTTAATKTLSLMLMCQVGICLLYHLDVNVLSVTNCLKVEIDLMGVENTFALKNNFSPANMAQ